LITITGPGGIGKTRLALAAAADQSAKFQHGAVFVPLAGVSSAQFLPQAILTALDVPLRGDLSPQQQVRAVLSSEERLLVLDNYEHLLPDVELLVDLLHYAPKTKLLVTSRERLALQAEHLHELAGLDYPPLSSVGLGANASRAWISYAAVQLFLQRVRQTHLRFTPNEEEMAAIVRICRISEGMPLALELTATLVRYRPLVEIAHQLEQGSRLEATRLRGLPDRHRSMWAVFDYSWHLLSPEEQHVFCGISVFRGGFQAEAAQAVVKSAPEVLAALVDKSLLRYQSGSPASGRYHIHELLRQYANQRLAETGMHETILNGHSAYFLHLAERAEPELYGAQQKSWLDRLTLEHDNLRAALSRCLLKDPEMALHLVNALSKFWFLGGYFNEGRNWLGQALIRTPADRTVTRGSALIGAGQLAWIQGDFEQATSLATESLNLFRLLDDLQNVARALHLLGNIQLFKNALIQARTLLEQVLALRRQAGNQAAIAGVLLDLGLVAMYENNYPQAKSLLEESLAIRRRTEDRIAGAVCLANLGYMELYFGNLSDATRYLREAVLVSLSHGDQETVVLCLEGFAEIAGAALENQNSLQTGACLFGTAQTFRHRLAIPLPPMDRPFYESSLAALRAHMNEATFATAWAAGAAMSLEEAVAYALAGSTSA
jgi:predicted ATPase